MTKHCEHECVCREYSKNLSVTYDPCCVTCQHDTRINGSAQHTPTDGKTAYSMWISERGFEQISYNPGAEEVWIAGYTYGCRMRSAQGREKMLDEVQLRLMDEMIEIGYHEQGDMWAPLKGTNEAFAELREKGQQ